MSVCLGAMKESPVTSVDWGPGLTSAVHLYLTTPGSPGDLSSLANLDPIL